jgi:hypothetical protein
LQIQVQELGQREMGAFFLKGFKNVPPGRPELRWVDNIRIDFREVGSCNDLQVP